MRECRDALVVGADAGVRIRQIPYLDILVRATAADEHRADALDWFQRAAALGHAKSINLIGGFYEDGWVVAVDVDAAFDHYRRAAEAGDFRGQFNYARLLAERGHID
jgi:hypothetical protein